jgi:hypothetical protein
MVKMKNFHHIQLDIVRKDLETLWCAGSTFQSAGKIKTVF